MIDKDTTALLTAIGQFGVQLAGITMSAFASGKADHAKVVADTNAAIEAAPVAVRALFTRMAASDASLDNAIAEAERINAAGKVDLRVGEAIGAPRVQVGPSIAVRPAETAVGELLEPQETPEMRPPAKPPASDEP